MANYTVDGNALVINNLPLPNFNTLSSETLSLLIKTNDMLYCPRFSEKTHSEHTALILKSVHNNQIKALEHRLSKHVDNLMFKNDNSSSNNEVNNIGKCLNIFEQHLNARNSFPELIKKLGSMIKGETIELRQGRIRSVPDSDNSYTEFLNVDLIVKSLEELRIFILKTRNQSELFTAIIASVYIVYIHPLTDGNGRLSRLFFNIITSRSHLNYLPFTEICHFARSGYVISMREAMLFSEWDSIIHFFCKSIILMNEKL